MNQLQNSDILSKNRKMKFFNLNPNPISPWEFAAVPYLFKDFVFQFSISGNSGPFQAPTRALIKEFKVLTKPAMKHKLLVNKMLLWIAQETANMMMKSKLGATGWLDVSSLGQGTSD